MKVILREHIPHLGRIGAIVNVPNGYGLNYLLPRNLAMVADERNVRLFEHNKRVAAVRLARAKEAARSVAEKLSGLRLVARRHVGEGGKLYGSVTMRDVAALLADNGYDVDRRDLSCPQMIKSTGTYEVTAELPGDVKARFSLVVEAMAAEEAPPEPEAPPALEPAEPDEYGEIPEDEGD
jgi:large subunit ribosomal protein L9